MTARIISIFLFIKTPEKFTKDLLDYAILYYKIATG
jgi:hypothetical protein